MDGSDLCVRTVCERFGRVSFERTPRYLQARRRRR
jgi:hypothetical protein